MPAYSFQKQFVPLVESGAKTHTIRGKRKTRPRVGQPFYGYFGMRTKQCRKIIESVITKVEDIRIGDHDMVGGDFTALRGLPLVVIDGNELTRSELDALATRDGFADAFAFWQFWMKHHNAAEVRFHGDIIHWKYPGEHQCE